MPKTILHSIRQGKIGGGESHVLSLVSRLDPKEYRSIVVAMTDGPMIDELKKIGVKSYVIHTLKPFNPLITKELCKIIKEENVDLIHAHGTRAASNSLRSAKKTNTPMIYTVHGWAFHIDQSPIPFYFRRASESYLTKNVNRTICVSFANERLGQELFRLKNSVVIHNGVDFEKFDHEKHHRSALRSELSIPEDAYLISYIVRMTMQKDPINLVESIAVAVKKSPKLHFLIVGDGELMTSVKSTIKQLRIGSHITLAGFRSDIPEVLSASDAYTLPSLWEGLPIGIIEAMAMKKAIVASNIEANAEMITNGEHGILVPVKQPEELAQAFATIANNKVLSDEFAKNAFNKANSWFQLDLMVERIAAVYNEELA